MDTDRKFLEGQVVIVGYRRVGSRITNSLSEKGIPFIVVEQNRQSVETLRNNAIPAVAGDASEPVVLVQAHIHKAAMLVIATPDSFDTQKIAEIATTLQPKIEIVVRTHNEEESKLLNKEKIYKVFFGEEELAKGMTKHVIERFTPS